MDDYISRKAAAEAIMNAEELYEPEWGNRRFSPTDVEEILNGVESADVRPVRPCDGCPFCVCEKHGVICPSDPGFRCDTRGGTDG